VQALGRAGAPAQALSQGGALAQALGWAAAPAQGLSPGFMRAQALDGLELMGIDEGGLDLFLVGAGTDDEQDLARACRRLTPPAAGQGFCDSFAE